MSTLEDRIQAAKAAEANRAKDLDRLAQQAAGVFSSDDGKELLGHLVERFGVLGRTFIPTDRGEVNALRAATRDGERAAVIYLLNLIRKADPKFNFPL